MTNVIETERLTKCYGSHRGIIEVDLAVQEGEVFGFLGPNGAGKTTTIRTLLDLIRPTSATARVFGIESTADPVAIHRRIGYLPGEFALYDRLTGGQHLEYFANLRGGVDPAYQAIAHRALRPRPVAPVQGVQQGQQAEGRPRHRPPAPARAALLDEPTSGLDPLVQQTFFSILREAVAGGRDGLPLLATSCPRWRRPPTGSAIIREGRLVKVGTVDALRDLAHHQVELRFAGEVPAAAFEAPAGRQRRASSRTTSCACASPGRSRRSSRRRRSYELLDFVSREPSLEETFLAQYGREAVEVG